MKKIAALIAFICFTMMASAQSGKVDTSKKIDTLEVSCGQCNFKLKTQKGCDLAVRINGKAYFVDGTDINDHGDAHGDDGFCNAIRTAKVQGKLVNDRFVVTYLELLPLKKNTK